MSSPPSVPFYIRLSCPKTLTIHSLRDWYATVCEELPAGVRSTEMVQDEDGGFTGVSLIQRETADRFIYTIPLSRHLIKQEGDRIARKMGLKAGDWDIECSSDLVQHTPEESTIEVEQGQFDALAEELAKRRHNRWVAMMQSQGWRHGDLDPNQRLHPLMRPWHDLPEAHRLVDYEVPQLTIDMLLESGYVVVKKDEFDSLVSINRR